MQNLSYVAVKSEALAEAGCPGLPCLACRDLQSFDMLRQNFSMLNDVARPSCLNGFTF